MSDKPFLSEAAMKCPYCGGTGELVGDHRTVGALVLAHRTQAKITQAQLAEQVGRSRAQIANIEAGRTDIPVSLLIKLASALGVPPHELVQ